MFLGRALPQGQSYLRSNNPNVPNESNGMGKLCVGHLGFGWRPGMGQQPAQLTHYRHAPHHFVNDFTPADVHVAEGRGEGDCHRPRRAVGLPVGPYSVHPRRAGIRNSDSIASVAGPRRPSAVHVPRARSAVVVFIILIRSGIRPSRRARSRRQGGRRLPPPPQDSGLFG